MKIVIVKDQHEGAKKGYEIIADAMENGNLNVFGLATGSTPITLYEEIVKSDLNFENVVSVNLDEYVGISGDHEQSYAYFMRKHLFNDKPFKANYLPNGMETDAKKECDRYDAIIASNPIDIQILGIGENGHIGFNEPGAPFDGLTDKVSLTESTIQANSRMFDSIDDVPKFAYSMGIKSILSAKKIVLFAYGEKKAEAIMRMVEQEPTTDLPASALQNHNDVTLIIDEKAASKLSNR